VRDRIRDRKRHGINGKRVGFTVLLLSRERSIKGTSIRTGRFMDATAKAIGRR
jgi:hypothetical protein